MDIPYISIYRIGYNRRYSVNLTGGIKWDAAVSRPPSKCTEIWKHRSFVHECFGGNHRLSVAIDLLDGDLGIQTILRNLHMF